MAAETRADAVELSMLKRTWWMMSEKRSKEWGFKNAEGDQAATYCRAERVIGICSRSLAILGITEKGVFEQCGTGVGRTLLVCLHKRQNHLESSQCRSSSERVRPSQT